MTKKEIAALSFRVLSIYAIIQAIDLLPYDLYLISNFHTHIISELMPPLLLIICGALLWLGAFALASMIFKASEPEIDLHLSLTDVQIVAFSVVGLALMGGALSDLVRFVGMSWSVNSRGGVSGLTPEIIGAALRLGLGFWLLFGSRGLVNFIRSMRKS